MKQSLSILFIFLLPAIAFAQKRARPLQSDTSKYVWREGWHAGIGIAPLHFNTHWNYIGSDVAGTSDDEATHSLDKTMVVLSLERRSIFGIRREKDFRNYISPVYDYYGYLLGWSWFKFYIDFDLGGELMYRVAGKTTADFLQDDNNVISSGGWAAGIGTYFRAQAVIPGHKCNFIWLSLGVNPQYAIIHNDAKGVPSLGLVENYQNNPWNESIFMLNGTIGTLGLEFGKFSIMPEIRLGLFGTSSSTLKTSKYGQVQQKGTPGFWGWNIKLATRL